MDKQRKQFIEHKEKGPKKLGLWSSKKASYIHLSFSLFLRKVAGKMVGGRVVLSLSLSRIVTKTKVKGYKNQRKPTEGKYVLNAKVGSKR